MVIFALSLSFSLSAKRKSETGKNHFEFWRKNDVDARIAHQTMLEGSEWEMDKGMEHNSIHYLNTYGWIFGVKWI